MSTLTIAALFVTATALHAQNQSDQPQSDNHASTEQAQEYVADSTQQESHKEQSHDDATFQKDATQCMIAHYIRDYPTFFQEDVTQCLIAHHFRDYPTFLSNSCSEILKQYANLRQSDLKKYFSEVDGMTQKDASHAAVNKMIMFIQEVKETEREAQRYPSPSQRLKAQVRNRSSTLINR